MHIPSAVTFPCHKNKFKLLVLVSTDLSQRATGLRSGSGARDSKVIHNWIFTASERLSGNYFLRSMDWKTVIETKFLALPQFPLPSV